MFRGSAKGAKKTAKNLRNVGKRTHGAIRKSLASLVLELMTKVKLEKLSGPGTGQALNVRTGRLRRSITQRITDSGREVRGIVGTNVEYAKFHEFGQSIKADLQKHREGFKAALKANKPALSAGDLPPRSFLRSALKDMEPRIREEFANAVKESSSTWRLL